MTATVVPDRNALAAEYLQLLRGMASEMEKAMQAIAHNRLVDLEESIANQQVIGSRLTFLASEISPSHAAAPQAPAVARTGVDAMLLTEVQAAGDALQRLNRRYAALLQHSSRSIALMTSLLSGYRGQLQQQHRGASGAGSKHQTWSCQM